MMPLVAVTQRVEIDPKHGERRDAIDQRWIGFLAQCSLTPVLLPNDEAAAVDLLSAIPVGGLLLTGGNNLVEYGGDTPERDRMERRVLNIARERRLPALGVCRGMQMMLAAFGVPLRKVEGHVATNHEVDGTGQRRTVNSYHELAAVGGAGPLTVLRRAPDGAVEEVSHPTLPFRGIMWHPERNSPFEESDRRLFREFFAGGKGP